MTNFSLQRFRSVLKIAKEDRGKGALFFHPSTGKAIRKVTPKIWMNMMKRFLNVEMVNAHLFRHIVSSLQAERVMTDAASGEERKLSCMEMSDVARANLHTRKVQAEHYILCKAEPVQNHTYVGDFERGKGLNLSLRGREFAVDMSLLVDDRFPDLITTRSLLGDMVLEQDCAKTEALEADSSDPEISLAPRQKPAKRKRASQQQRKQASPVFEEPQEEDAPSGDENMDSLLDEVERAIGSASTDEDAAPSGYVVIFVR
jgi:hypothetical protein